MSTTSQRQPEARSSADIASSPTTPVRHGRARHARTNASLTSSIGSSSADASLSVDRLPRRSSVPSEAARIFQATGFDPFGTEADTLFNTLTVKEVEAYERAVRTTALGKQQELRSLVGQRYEDLLGTANTIIDMAGSSKQLSQRLHELSNGVNLAAVTGDKVEASSKKADRRKSFLPTQRLSPALEASDASALHQEAIYVLGASLRLIMDAPEYVWKSIEKGKTLQASWAYMLARATWNDLIEPSSHPGSQSALVSDTETDVSSVSEAVSLLRVNVKKAFPFIEKQWQTMLPMRKQVVHRAVSLLSDTQIESMAVVDQLAALSLLDGTKTDHACHLLLSQRLTAMRRMLQRQQSKSSSHHRAASRHAISPSKSEAAASTSHAITRNEDKAARASQTIAELVTLFARTLQHAVQIFVLPSKAHPGCSSKPLLLDLLDNVTDPANFAPSTPAATSPDSERTLVLSQPSPKKDALTSRQNAAVLRAQRRRSSYGLPGAETVVEAESEAIAEPHSQAERSRPLRVSTAGVVEALPSGRILSRLLPPSFWTFAPQVDLEVKDPHSSGQILVELSTWSTKARETLIGSSDSTTSGTVRSLLSGLSDVSELALVRRSLRISLHRLRRIVSRKLGGLQEAGDARHKGAVTTVHAELDRLEEAMDAVLQERLSDLMSRKLDHAVQTMLQETGKIVAALEKEFSSQDDALSRVDTPLDALFRPIETDSASQFDQVQSSAKYLAGASYTSRSYSAALQDHLCGRSKQVDRLASLYEIPLATLSQELHLYQEELEADDRFAEAKNSIKVRFESILNDSREDVEMGLKGLLEQAASLSSNTAGQQGVSKSTSLVMQIVAVLSETETGLPGRVIREPVKASLRRFWRPQLEQRISALLGAGATRAATDTYTDGTTPSVSSPTLCALAMLSESIVQLGPALAGPELAEQVRDVLKDMADNDALSAGHSDAIRGLLTADAASLSKNMAADANLHSIRLTLAPLVLALGTTAPGSEPNGAAFTALARAEPASAIGNVKSILNVSRKKMDRFSPLPVRS